MRRLLLPAVLACVACTASPIPQPSCTPGASSACACTNGASGAQTCGADRVLGACVCTDASASPDAVAADVTSTADVTSATDVPDAVDPRDTAPPDVPASDAGFDVPSPDVPSSDVADAADAPDVPITCPVGFGDCNGSAADGCESALATSLRHCGACGTVCAAGTTCVAGACRAIPLNGLVAHYPLDGTAEDATLLSPTGVVTRAVPSPDRCGGSAGALDFAGEASIVMPTNPRLPIGAAARTVAVWLRVQPEHFAGIVINWGTVMPRQRCSLQLQASTGLTLFSGESSDVTSRSRIGDGRWHFVAATYDGSRATLYIDGASEGSETMTLATTRQELAIARLVPSDPRPLSFTGQLDDVRIYNRALTPDEIATLHRERGCAP
ncbi:MAG: LamG domain-containing protein [Deltaproteobacteria bacterium]|nr:LamG domain-containing protein [Myxococcales bacterium]MDP3220548.1 LamG domain-containing protein [Deltaproteobacteria bacterium]